MKQEVLGWIAAQGEFGEHHQIGTALFRSPCRLAHALGIALHVADKQVQLRQRDAGTA